jgi:hypothetical protein
LFLVTYSLNLPMNVRFADITCRLDMHRGELDREEGGRYNRWNKQTSGSSTLLSYFQPAIAWVGFIGSLLVVFVFSTAQWWNGVISVSKVASGYASVS